MLFEKRDFKESIDKKDSLTSFFLFLYNNMTIKDIINHCNGISSGILIYVSKPSSPISTV